MNPQNPQGDRDPGTNRPVRAPSWTTRPWAARARGPARTAARPLPWNLAWHLPWHRSAPGNATAPSGSGHGAATATARPETEGPPGGTAAASAGAAAAPLPAARPGSGIHPGGASPAPRAASASAGWALGAGPWAVVLLLALLAGLPWMLATARLGWPPGTPLAVPAQAGLSIALEGDTTPAAYEEGGPPIAVGSAADARVFLRQFAPELAAAGSEILTREGARQGWQARRVTLAQLVLLRDGQVVARYDVATGDGTRPAWIRFARLTNRWHPVRVVVGEPGQVSLPSGEAP